MPVPVFFLVMESSPIFPQRRTQGVRIRGLEASGQHPTVLGRLLEIVAQRYILLLSLRSVTHGPRTQQRREEPTPSPGLLLLWPQKLGWLPALSLPQGLWPGLEGAAPKSLPPPLQHPLGGWNPCWAQAVE